MNQLTKQLNTIIGFESTHAKRFRRISDAVLMDYIKVARSRNNDKKQDYINIYKSNDKIQKNTFSAIKKDVVNTRILDKNTLVISSKKTNKHGPSFNKIEIISRSNQDAKLNANIIQVPITNIKHSLKKMYKSLIDQNIDPNKKFFLNGLTPLGYRGLSKKVLNMSDLKSIIDDATWSMPILSGEESVIYSVSIII